MSAVSRSVSEFDVAVGQRLKAARIESGVSQSEVASQLGLTFQQIQKYERGLNRMPAAHYRKLNEILGLDLSDLLMVSHSRSPFADFARQQGAQELARAFLTLSSSQRKLVLQMTKALASNEPQAVDA
ncbi:Helix-turn-helix domain protein [compost metagenome]|jgi:transcriptional regulator with XRE-family HTH domain